MPAPYPYEFVGGRSQLSSPAEGIYGHYGWIARWSVEIETDADLDVKKLSQLGLHCSRFQETIDPFRPLSAGDPIVSATRSVFQGRGVRWATDEDMIADLEAVRTVSINFISWFDAKRPAPRKFAERTFDADWNEVEQAVKEPKTAAITTEVAKLRALFA